jgi:hypothetical protein
MKIKLLTIAAVVALGAAGSAMAIGQAVSIDTVHGSVISGSDSLVYSDSTLTLYIRMTTPDSVVQAFSNGFKIYSPDGAEWGATTGDTVVGGPVNEVNFDFVTIPWVNTFSITGSGADTIGFQASVLAVGTGFPAGTDAVTHFIEIGPIDQQYDGDTVCIDSAFYPNAGTWTWSAAGGIGDGFIPAWSGPHCFQISTDGTDVNTRAADGLPTEWMMSQNYPNPFNPVTQIAFDVPSRAHVTLNVFNVLGQQVATLVDQELARGSYTADWDGTSSSGGEVASGVYFYRLETDNYIDTKKMVLMK